jgi:hypothetical protein
MMGRRIAVVGGLLLMLLGAPRPSNAGLLEIIWEMTGPQMLGLGYSCMHSPKTQTIEQCRWSPLVRGLNTTTGIKGPFLVFGGSILGSTGVDSPSQDYDWLEIGMVTLDPGVAVRSHNQGDVQVHHAVGLSYNLIFGRDVETFHKWAITVTPYDITIVRFAVGLKLRLYPNGFLDEEFKRLPATGRSHPFETTVAFTFSLIDK